MRAPTTEDGKGRERQRGRKNGVGRLREETHYQPVSRNRGTGHERATVFVNVTTKLSAVPRLTRHSLKFHREIAPPARRTAARVEGREGSATLPIARARGLITRGWPGDTKAIRSERALSLPLPFSLIFHRCTLELSRLNPDYGRNRQ